MKKSLSILLALLMILSSLPIMTFAASAEQADPNVMADYTYANWQTRRWGSSNEGTESLNGGNSIYLKGVNYQTAFTTVTLEPNTTYLLDFNWKSDTNENLNGIFLRNLYVFAESTYGSNEALLAPAPSSDLGTYAGSGSWHHDNGDFYPAGATDKLTALGADLESETADSDPRKNATAGTWQHIATKFTTNSTDTEYAIMPDFQFNSTGNAGPNAIHLSDFRLISIDDSAAIAIEDKVASDWFIPANAKIYDDYSLTQDGITSDYLWTNPVWQKLSTTVTLDPNTKYVFEFDYYVEKYDANQHRMRYVEIFSAEQGSVLDTANWTGEDYNKEKIGLIELWDFVNTQTDPSKTGMWHHAKFTFDTIGSETYNIILHGTGAGNNAHDQKIYFANFELDTLVAKKPGNLLNNASYASGDVSWSVATGDMASLLDPRMSFNYGLDNPAFSINGGYAWGFGFAGAALSGDNFAYVHINADGLKAGKTYDFSYINRVQFRFEIDSIKCGDHAVTNYIVAPAYENVASPDGKAAQITTAMFTVPVDGDYVITLKANRDSKYHMPGIEWTTTYLCDLELYERGALYTVAVDTEGNGAAKADKAGLIEEGTVVTFTATPELYERFLGWYVGDELVSEDLTYVATVEGALAPVAKFTSNSENLMSDYTAANFGAMPNGAVADFAHSNYGGNGIHATKVPHQNVFTTVTLEAGKEYTFGFNWKSEENIYNKAYPNTIQVFQKAAGDPFDASSWNDNKWPPYQGDLTTYPDIENGGGYTNQDIANTCTWQSLITSFTPTVTAEYVIMINLTFAMQDLGDGNLKHYNNNQGIYFSDFVLKTEPVIEYTGTHYDWNGVHWSEVTDSADTRYGGYAYKVAKAMSQNINTTLNLKPGTTYRYSFNWKSVANDKGLAYVDSSSIYSAKSGDATKGNKTNYKWNDAGDDYVPVYVPNEGYSNLMTDVSNPNGSTEAEDSVLKNWNTYSATFTTIEDEDYYLFLNFGLKGAIGNQDVIVSDFVIEEVVKGSAPAADEMIAHPGVSIRKASESTFGQALRYKFTIAGSVIANAQADGYELVEYGTVVALVDELAGHAADPIMNATSYTVRKGVAYNKDDGTNIQFAVATNGDVTYTAALYNIPTENYSSSIAVRPYAIFRNADGDSYVRYGTTRVASVFGVAKAILEGSNSDDIAYVNNVLLAGDIKAAYDAWVAEQ